MESCLVENVIEDIFVTFHITLVQMCNKRVSFRVHYCLCFLTRAVATHNRVERESINR